MLGFGADTPVPPVYSSKLSIPRSGGAPDQTAQVDPAQCTLHVSPDASFRHGVTVGMTVVSRDSNGRPLSAAGLPYVYNVTGVGDSNTGTVFDLQNGTLFVYSTVYYSPAIDKSPGAEVWVRLNGIHIRGSPRRIPIAMESIALNYQSRLHTALKVGREESLGGEDGCDGDFVIVTGASQHMFDRAVNLVGSIHHWAPQVPVLFFDLGLSSVQAEDVQTWEGVEYLRFDFSGYPEHVGSLGERGAYAWRSPILVNVSETHRCMLWLDAGLELRADIAVIKGHIAVDGHFFVTNGWPSPNRFTHPAVLEWHGLTEADLFTAEGGSVRHEIEACGGIQGYRRGSVVHQTILQGYHRCSMDPECMTPPGVSKKNFRQDQTVLNVVLAVYRAELELDSEEYFMSLAHTARKYWEHPIPKHEFPVGDDGTFKPCDKGQVFKDGECQPCDSPDGFCEDDDVLDELPGAQYVDDLIIFIRRAFEPKLYEESLKYRLTGAV